MQIPVILNFLSFPIIFSNPQLSGYPADPADPILPQLLRSPSGPQLLDYPVNSIDTTD